jgi:hypothetical protein
MYFHEHHVAGASITVIIPSNWRVDHQIVRERRESSFREFRVECGVGAFDLLL